jgi:hypothetical protein
MEEQQLAIDRESSLGRDSADLPRAHQPEAHLDNANRSEGHFSARDLEPVVQEQATFFSGSLGGGSSIASYQGDLTSWTSTNSLDVLINSFTHDSQTVHTPAIMQQDLMAMWADVPAGFGYALIIIAIVPLGSSLNCPQLCRLEPLPT